MDKMPRDIANLDISGIKPRSIMTYLYSQQVLIR